MAHQKQKRYHSQTSGTFFVSANEPEGLEPWVQSPRVAKPSVSTDGWDLAPVAKSPKAGDCKKSVKTNLFVCLYPCSLLSYTRRKTFLGGSDASQYSY